MRRVFLGLLLLLLVGGGVYWWGRQYREGAPEPMAEVLPWTDEEESLLEARVGMIIPEDGEKARLEDVSGGAALGVATRKVEEGVFKHTIIADLPEVAGGEFYQGWLAEGEELVATEKLEEEKGGWVLEYTSEEDKSDLNQAIVTREAVDDDQPEEKVLEGSF